MAEITYQQNQRSFPVGHAAARPVITPTSSQPCTGNVQATQLANAVVSTVAGNGSAGTGGDKK